MFIRSNTFTSSGGYLLAPYNTVHKFAAIVLDDVERVVIGDSSLNASVLENVIEKSRFGVFSNKSSIEVYKNSFKDLEAFDEPIPDGLTLHWPKLTYFSIGVYNLSAFDFNDRKLIIGEAVNNSGNDTRNYFSNINYGVYSQSESNVKIRLNDFGIGNEDFDYGSIGVSINYPGNKNVDISNRNEFKSYTYGVLVNQLSQGTSLTVNDNRFYYGWTNNNSYTGTGISILNASPVKPLVAEIKGNILGDYIGTNFYFPRIGIRAAKVEGVNISSDNQVYFNLATSPSGYYSGIWLQDCDRAKVTGNKLVNISAPSTLYTLNDLLVGLRVDESHGTCIEQNSMESMGQGMRFSGNSIVYSLFSNVTNGFDQGIYLNFADIGSQQGWNSIAIKNDLDNYWVRSSGPTTDRIQGQTGNGIPIDWNTRATSASDSRYPDGPSNTVRPVILTGTSYSMSQCPEEESSEPPYSSNARNASFGTVTGDSGRYIETYYYQFKYQAEAVLLREIKQYLSLLSMNDSADGSFQSFYENNIESNYSLFDSITTLIATGNLDEALSMTESITDTNEIEFCQKQVWIVYLNRILQGDALTTVDSNLLDSIAHLNAIVFGSGVRMARLLLNLELYDELESGSRMASQIRKAELPFDIKLVPNPASWSLRVIPSIQYTDAMITIQDLSGRIIYQRPNAHEVDLSLFSSGSYLLKYTAETNTVTKLFVIQK